MCNNDSKNDCKKDYKNWQLVKYEEMPDYKACGVHYKHKKTGMEVFHLVNDDEENLFSFAFKTLSENSRGAAHILEHSVLCGSKNYPLKDPFMQLNSQSVKTFLNAMTFPDKTVYPASSMVEADYFNLMAVYGDAVFFPLLSEHIFEQEAHRFEADEKGNLTIQGVVYNEMKGSYSSFDNIVSDYSLHAMLPNTSYQYDSGGDPTEIPLLTHQQLKDFHEKYYAPSNCRVFLCGNIPTEKQLDFIEAHFLGDLCTTEQSPRDTNTVQNKFIPFETPQTLSLKGPSSEDEKESTVQLSWVLGKSADTELYMESVVIAEILMGHDGSPLTRALLDSKLGEDTAPGSGLEGEIAHLMFTAGMRGVKPENAEKLQDCILGVMATLVKDGISPEHLEAAIMAVDFSHREVRRSHGPWSLVLMRRTMRGWFNGTDPFSPLKTREVFERIKERIKTCPDGTYLKGLIKKFFLDNNHRLLLTVTPDSAYDTERDAQYKALLTHCTDSTEVLAKKQEALQEFQHSGDDEKSRSLIPHLKPSQFDDKIDRIATEKTTIGGIPAFVHNEAVNGIVYVDVAIPVDILEPELYSYLPFFTTALTNCGFADMDWAQASAHTARTVGGFGANLFTASATEWAKKQASDPLVGRDWIFIRVKMLTEKLEQGIALLFDCLTRPIFTDTERLHDLAIEYRNDFAASIVPAGHEYALSRSACTQSRSKAIDEIWNGLRQLYTCRTIATMPKADLSKKLEGIAQKLLGAGLTLNITADTDTIEQTKKILATHLQNFSAPKNPPTVSDQVFFELTQVPPQNETSTEPFPIIEKDTPAHLTNYIVQSQTGFASAVFPASAFGTSDAVYESLFSHWFSNNILWEQIRTIGGAYSGFSYTDAIEQLFAFVTYRDPEPHRSLEVFERCLADAVKLTLDEPTLERLITGCYSKEVQPRAPSARGFIGFIRQLYGITDEEREQKMRTLLSAKASDIQEAAKRLLKNSANVEKSVVYGKK